MLNENFRAGWDMRDVWWAEVVAPCYNRINTRYEDARNTALPVAIRVDAVRHMADGIRYYVVLVRRYLANAKDGKGQDLQESIDCVEAGFDIALNDAQKQAVKPSRIHSTMTIADPLLADESAATYCHVAARELLGVFDEIVQLASSQGLHGPLKSSPSSDPLGTQEAADYLTRLMIPSQPARHMPRKTPRHGSPRAAHA